LWKINIGNAILQLDKATSGQILYRVRILLNLEMQQSKLKEIQIIFQDPYSSLNPKIPIGKAIMEPMKVHGLHKMTKKEAKTIEILERVGLEPSILIDIHMNFLEDKDNVSE
jgi:peptide/nickel transport system ATP-binding protein